MNKKIIPIICLFPLIAGTVGYLMCGEMITDAIYAGFALYFTNPVSDAYNGYIEFARWTAPLVTVTAIVSVLKNVWDNICWRTHLFFDSDSVAVYSDEDIQIAFELGTRAIYPGDSFKGYAKNHIILFSSDEKNLKFYEAHREQLKTKTVYIGMKELELGLLKEMNDVTLFDINGSIARLLWKKIALWKSDKEALRIVIYGSSSLAQAILSVGLQFNLFSLTQHIQYNVVSDNHLFQIKHYGMALMNGDEIHYYGTEDVYIWEAISRADVVIIADRIPMDLLQTVIVRARDSHVYYYSPKVGDAFENLSFGNLIPFGRNTEVFTDKNIRRRELIKNAVELNEKYAEKYHTQKDWNHLSGFLKASNISSADYKEVIADLLENRSVDVLAELEHIRWCRFHFLNYWKYGILDNSKNKDTEQRIHRDLIPYDLLHKDEKVKDVEAIKEFQKNAAFYDTNKS